MDIYAVLCSDFDEIIEGINSYHRETSSPAGYLVMLWLTKQLPFGLGICLCLLMLILWLDLICQILCNCFVFVLFVLIVYNLPSQT